MPQSGQIIPKYQFPNVEVVINDNTIYNPKTPTTDPLVRAFHVFTSDKGRDGVILKMNSVSSYQDEYGVPNFALHGQAPYMPYASLSGNGSCYCMRITDDAAAFANVMLIACVKFDNVSQKFQIKFISQTDTVTNVDQIDTLMAAALKEGVDVDAEGFSHYPLMTYFSTGKGIYGDYYRARITSDNKGDKTYGFKNYVIEFLSAESGLRRIDRYPNVSLWNDAAVGSTSFFINDVINDTDTGSSVINVDFNYGFYEKFLNYYNTNTTSGNKLDVKTADLLFGKIIGTSTAITDIEYLTGLGIITLDNPNGIPLESGDDGKFSKETASIARDQAISAAYIKAFQGKTNKGIKSKKRYPVEFFFDANYPEEVKTELVKLVQDRGDCQCYLDAGLQPTTTTLTAWAVENANKGDRQIMKEGHWYEIKDPNTGKRIQVTTTYYLATILPSHLKNNSLNTPVTGTLYAKLNGHIKNSLQPVIDADDNDIKEILYENRVNYYEATAENTFVRSTQSTSQLETSDLLEENNMRVLLAMKRDLETMSASQMYNFAEPEDRKKFTEAADRLISKYKSMVRTAKVSFGMNAYEEQRGILHCYLEIIFKTMVKSGIIEIDINSRV